MPSLKRDLIRALTELRYRVLEFDLNAEYRRTPLWGGADVRLVERPPRRPAQEAVVLVTPHAKELSWLFFQLGNVLAPLIDFQNKYAIYSRLAIAAMPAMPPAPDPDLFTLAQLERPEKALLRVLNEARRLVHELTPA